MHVLDLSPGESSLLLPPWVLGRQREMDGQADQTPEEEQEWGHGSGDGQKPVGKGGNKRVGVPGTTR